jgi:hypothetical protein
MYTQHNMKRCSTGKKLAPYPIVSTEPVCPGRINIQPPPTTPFGSTNLGKLFNSPKTSKPYNKQ